MFVFVDCETSGLTPDHDITECAAIVVEKSSKWKTNPKKVFHKRFLLQNEKIAEKEALEIGHYNETVWQKNGVSAKDGLLEFNEWLKEISPSEKPTCCAHNSEFDKSMILSNSDRYSIFIYCDESWIDSIAVWKLYKLYNNLTHLGNSNKAMCNYFDIKNVKAHNALSDTVSSAQCFAIMLNELRFQK